MAYRFKTKESFATGAKRIACEQLDKALAEIEDSTLDRHQVVHQVRKRCKKLRGLLRLIRPSLGAHYQPENAWFRDSARLLSDLRDAQVQVETAEMLINQRQAGLDPDRFAEIQQLLEQRREQAASEQNQLEKNLAEFQARMQEARQRVADWPLGKTGFKLAEKGLKKTYRRGRKARKAAYQKPTAEAFHDWRKRVKYHWYHIHLLESVWPALLQPRAAELKKLADLLGDEHDLAVLRETLQGAKISLSNQLALKDFTALIEKNQNVLRQQAAPLGMKIYAEQPADHVRRLKKYWEAPLAE